MKIGFIVGSLNVAPVFTLNEIRKAEEKLVIIDGKEKTKICPGLVTFSEESYWKIRCLEIHPEFEKEIVKVRRVLKIPDDGLSYREYLEYYSPLTLSDTSDTGKRINNEVKNILVKFHCDEYVKTQLKNILLANIVLPIESDGDKRNGISVYSILDEKDLDNQNYDSSEKAVFIKITSSVKSEAIVDFIENNRDKFNTLLNNLPISRGYDELSEEKISILGMKKHDKKIKYSKMADLWIDVCHVSQKIVKNKENKTDDAFGQYYRRTIVDLFKKKSNKKLPGKM